MPSRKKAKGKARKAAKETKAKEEESRAVGEVANQRQVQEETLEAQLQRLIVNAACPTMECKHGYTPLSPDDYKICRDFIEAFIATFCLQGNFTEAFLKATEATEEEYADVYSSKLDAVISLLLARGTHFILEHEEGKCIAPLYASLACYFEDYIAIEVQKTRAVPNFSKMFELLDTDDHTLVSFYRKHIPCACLDEKYKEVKSVKKVGMCYNTSCGLPYGRVDRSKMLSCTRCGMANYCSVECQKNHWKKHKTGCDAIVKQRAAQAAFESNQT